MNRAICIVALCAGGALASQANADFFTFLDPVNTGFSAEAEFTLINANTLEVRLKNTSTSNAGQSGADIILTGLSWDMPGTITGGTVVTGGSSFSINFDTGVGANANLGGEWGYNAGGALATGMLGDMISGNTSQMVAFGGPNLDGPAGLDGPQAGLISAASAGSLGGQAAIQDELVATLTVSNALSDLSFLSNTAPRIEWGSDFSFVDAPTPGTLAIAGLSGLTMIRRRRK